jgi:hypothetical protein
MTDPTLDQKTRAHGTRALAWLAALALPLLACGSSSNTPSPDAAAGGAGGGSGTGTGGSAAGGSAGDASATGGAGGGNDGGDKDGGANDGPSASDGGDGPALTACSSLVNPLYVMSGDTQVPILKALGKALRQDATTPTTLVWQATGSCSIIDAVYNNTPLKVNLSYIPADPSWDPNAGTVPTCAPDAAGAPVQLGIPIVFPASCTSTPTPASVEVVKGPVQSFVFVVPTASTAQAISAEQAYMVFGFGAAGMVSPWTDEMFYFVRPATKGTQVSLGAIIKVPAAKWKGQPQDQSTSVASMVAASTSPDKTIGILGAEIYDSAANRAALRALSFEGFGQTGGYFPDTGVTAFDKRNVRDGHYLGWSHVFYLTPTTGTTSDTPGTVDARAARVIDILTGATTAQPPAGLDPLALVAGKGLVPLCAMNVQRSAEGGALSANMPSDPCGCAYEAAVGAAPASCTACSASAPCATGKDCRHGFCEAPDGRTALADCASAPASDADIPNFACSGRTVAPMQPRPQKVVDNGGQLPPLP